VVDLFQTTKQNISLHIRNIFEEGELVEEREQLAALAEWSETISLLRARALGILGRKP
jgi:hypothetical protein